MQEKTSLNSHIRSLQQRLEQLVAVHRQLLRRFASLEFENSESRKKLTLRDDRIHQLEENAIGFSSNMRSQAELHAADLSVLRQQIMDLRAEHTQRLEVKPMHGTKDKTVRGGGGQRSPHHNSSGGEKASGAKAGVFSRIFGIKNSE